MPVLVEVGTGAGGDGAALVSPGYGLVSEARQRGDADAARDGGAPRLRAGAGGRRYRALRQSALKPDADNAEEAAAAAALLELAVMRAVDEMAVSWPWLPLEQ